MSDDTPQSLATRLRLTAAAAIKQAAYAVHRRAHMDAEIERNKKQFEHAKANGWKHISERLKDAQKKGDE